MTEVDFAKAIKVFAEKQNRNIGDIERECGKCPGWLNRVIKGNGAIGLEDAQNLCKALKLELFDVISYGTDFVRLQEEMYKIMRDLTLE